MTSGEVSHLVDHGPGSFLWFGPSFGLNLIGLLVGVLTNAPLVGVNYKVVGTGHSLFL